MAEKPASPNHNCIDYVEFGVADIARAKAFYGAAFGWTFTEYGPDYCEFQDGRLTGGFTTLTPPNPGGPQAGPTSGPPPGSPTGPLVVLFADDLESAQARVEAAGGRISKPIFNFPGGRRFQFTDPDGYELAVWAAVDAE
ncbi:MAG: VOC family protein [Rhodospirillales bacterium]